MTKLDDAYLERQPARIALEPAPRRYLTHRCLPMALLVGENAQPNVTVVADVLYWTATGEVRREAAIWVPPAMTEGGLRTRSRGYLLFSTRGAAGLRDPSLIGWRPLAARRLLPQARRQGSARGMVVVSGSLLDEDG